MSLPLTGLGTATASPPATRSPAPAALSSTAAAAAPGDPAVVGRWGKPFQLGHVPIHATLMRNGELLFFQYMEGDPATDHTSYVWTWNPRTGASRQVPLNYDRDFFCAGTNVLPGGRVFLSGGHGAHTGKQQDFVGVAETDVYDPITRKFTRGPDMTQKRWYPTNVAMPSGKTLIFGGGASLGDWSNTIDLFDPKAMSMQTVQAATTEHMGNYPRLHLVRNGKVIKVGTGRMTKYFDPKTRRWSNVAGMKFGSRIHGTTVLLPGNGTKILTVGGKLPKATGPTNTAEILDTSAAHPSWKYTGSMKHPRLHATPVILPTGNIFVVGGGEAHRYVNPVKVPEMYYPKTGKFRAMAPHQGARMYHNVAILLPDGRVLSAGQDDGPHATMGEIYSPPYMFNGGRPRITAAPRTTGYGQRLKIATPRPRRIGKVMLMSPGSVTHDIDPNQRAIPLNFKVTRGGLTARTPKLRSVAPPGYYMIFILNRKNVPSVAKFVKLQ